MVAGLVAVSVIARGGASEVPDAPPAISPSVASSATIAGPAATLAKRSRATSPDELALTPPSDEFFVAPFIGSEATPTEDDFFTPPFPADPPADPFIGSEATPTGDDFFTPPFPADPPADPRPITQE